MISKRGTLFTAYLKFFSCAKIFATIETQNIFLGT